MLFATRLHGLGDMLDLLSPAHLSGFLGCSLLLQTMEALSMAGRASEPRHKRRLEGMCKVLHIHYTIGNVLTGSRWDRNVELRRAHLKFLLFLFRGRTFFILV